MSEAIVHAEARGHEAGHHELGFFRTYVFSTDHKQIGKQFLTMGLSMLVLGGVLALLVRWELAWPETAVPGMHWVPEPTMYDGIIPPETYNAFFTMHATIMIFFAVMPILVGCFGNFLIPLMIGARDMAFPLLNMLSFWTAVPGRSIPVWFKATVAGKYEVPCAELCGFGHSGMRGWVYVDTPEKYEAWAREKGVGLAGTTGGQS